MDELVEAVKSYRKPRRRPAHLRTKTGCLTCRQRKKKCDENLGVCHNCIKRKVDCVWQSPPNWKKASNPSLAENGDPSTFSPVAQCFRVDRLEAIEDVDQGTLTDLSTPSASSSPRSYHSEIDDINLQMVIAPQLGSAFSSTEVNSAPLLDYMRLVFVPQLVRPAMGKRYAEDFTRGSLQLASNFPFFTDALLACSAAEVKENDIFHLQLAESYYLKAVGGMRTYLATTSASLLTEIIALRTVMILCVFERTRLYRSAGVFTHLCGAAALLQSCCEQMEASRRTPDLWLAARILSLEPFVFHVATSIPFQDPPPASALVNETFSRALHILEQLWLENKMGYSFSPLLGAPPKLFGYVRQVALLYSQFRSHNVDVTQCQSLERDLRRWSDDNISNLYAVNFVNVADSADNNPRIYSSGLQDANHFSNGPGLYVLAARALLERMMALSSETRGQHPSASLSVLLARAMLLVRAIEPSVDYFAEYYCWPFYCVGVSLDDKQDQEVLMNKIMAFWKSTRNGTMRRLADILTDEWT